MIHTLGGGPAVRTLLVSDLVRSTELVQKLGDARAAELFAELDSWGRDLLREHEGVEVDRADGFLLLFQRPSPAVEYALRYHRALATSGKAFGLDLRARVGIHLGEVLVRENSEGERARGAKAFEVEGLAKPIAARLMGLAGGGQTLLTQGAFDLARHGSSWRAASGTGEEVADVPGLSWRAHGRYQFQGIQEPASVFEVGELELAPLVAPLDSPKARRLQEEGAVLGWRPGPGLVVPGRPAWVLDRRLGQGGVGEVWSARHEKIGDQRVYKFCYDLERLRSLQRETTLFRLLKEVLGDRQDILRILDWNFSEPPYFVETEYTNGGSLLDWAESQGGISRVPLEQRLELVAQIADALAAAHSLGILHKDVKPANVLIHEPEDGPVQIRLADFGVGTLIDPALLDDLGVTRLGLTDLGTEVGSHSGGTPLFRAPELLEGRAATVQADIYSLGVLLYQMVVGDLSRALGPGWERNVEDELLREDIARAVDVDPKRRARDVGGIAERIRSLAERRRACQAEETERREREEASRALTAARRRRKRMTLLAVILTVSAIAIGFQARRASRAAAYAAVEAERANAEARAAENVAGFLVELMGEADPQRALGQETTVREVLDRGALKLTDQLEDQPAVRARLLDAVGAVYRSLGLLDESAAQLELAIELRRSGAGDGVELARSLNQLGWIYHRQSRNDEAVRVLDEAVGLLEASPRAALFDLAHSFNSLAVVAAARGETDRAESLYRRSIESLEAELEPDELAIANRLNNLAILYADTLRVDEATELYQRVLDIRLRLLGEKHPMTASVLNNFGYLEWQCGEYAGAEQKLQRSLAARLEVLGAEHQAVASTSSNLAGLYLELGRLDEAEDLAERALEIERRRFGPVHPKLFSTIVYRARIHRARGETDEARSKLASALEMHEALDGGDPVELANALLALANLELERGLQDSAAEFVERAGAALDKLPPGHPARQEGSRTEARWVLARNPSAIAEARALLDRALEEAETGPLPRHLTVAQTWLALGSLHEQTGDSAAAASARAAARTIRSSYFDSAGYGD